MACVCKAPLQSLLILLNMTSLYAMEDERDAPQSSKRIPFHQVSIPRVEDADARKLYNLGVMYLDGKGVAQDDRKAHQYFTQAAERGYVAALNSLGAMYWYGKGVDQDDREAHQYFTQAAERGVVEALYNLGLMYRDGKGVDQDYRKAHQYFTQAIHKKCKISHTVMHALWKERWNAILS